MKGFHVYWDYAETSIVPRDKVNEIAEKWRMTEFLPREPAKGNTLRRAIKKADPELSKREFHYAVVKEDDSMLVYRFWRVIKGEDDAEMEKESILLFDKEDEDWPNKSQIRSTHGVTHSCNFCVHRLDRGGKPACVEACAKAGCGAIHVGDLNDPKSEVAGLIAENPVQALREDLGTKPKVFYIGL